MKRRRDVLFEIGVWAVALAVAFVAYVTIQGTMILWSGQ